MAYKKFFKAKSGFPKFKKRGQWYSITYPQYNNFPTDNNIIVPKIGNIKIVYHREIPQFAKIKTLTIRKSGDKWFACFSVEKKEEKKENFQQELKQGLSSVIGIDLGLIYFYYASDDSNVPVPKYFRKKEKQLKKLQRKLSRREKRTKKYYKTLRAIQKVHYRIKCQREDFLHKTANALLQKCDIIIYENLSISNMIRRPTPIQAKNGYFLPNAAGRKSRLNKSIADVGWYKFILFLNYKAKEHCKITIAVNPQYTSQKCSSCGVLIKKSLSTRTHICNNCGFVADRDYNAALNILRLGMQSLGNQSLEAPSINR